MAVEYWGLVDENSIFRGVNLKSCVGWGGGGVAKKVFRGHMFGRYSLTY